MKFGLSTLLPKLFSQRWIQMMSVVDSLLSDLQDQLIEPIFNQYNVDTATNEQILNDIKTFGYELSYLDGFSSSREYLIRQYISLGRRIKGRGIKDSYEVIQRIYFQKGTVYPLYYDNISRYYIPYETWWDLYENLQIITTLDSEADNLLYFSPQYFDTQENFDNGVSFDYDVAVYGSPRKTKIPEGFLDTPELIETLDQFYEIQNLTRYVYVQIICRRLLGDSEFFDLNAMTSFIYDMNKNHRPTEVLYFFPKIYLYTKTDKTQTDILFEKYDETSTKNMRSIWLSDTMEDVQYIKYGTGYRDVLSGITDLVEQTQSYTINQMYIKEKTPIILSCFPIITRGVQTFSFSEIGLFNSLNQLIYYACFPSIIFPDNIRGGNEIYIKLDTEENITNFYNKI